MVDISSGLREVLNLTDLGDVTISGIANNDVLRYNSTSGEWENVASGGSGSLGWWTRTGTALDPTNTGDTVEVNDVEGDQIILDPNTGTDRTRIRFTEGGTDIYAIEYDGTGSGITNLFKIIFSQANPDLTCVSIDGEAKLGINRNAVPTGQLDVVPFDTGQLGIFIDAPTSYYGVPFLYNRGGVNQIKFLCNGGAIFNSQRNAGANADFRIASDLYSHVFFTHSTNNCVGINESSPIALLSLSETSDGARSDNLVSIDAMSDFYGTFTDRGRMSMGNKSNSNYATAIYHWAGTTEGYDTRAGQWELGCDYEQDTTNSYYLYSVVAGQTRWYVASDGDMAIGIDDDASHTSPEAKLHVIQDRIVEGQPAILAEIQTTGTTSARETLSVKAVSTGNMVAGFGPQIAFKIEDNAGVDREIAQLDVLHNGDDTYGKFRFVCYGESNFRDVISFENRTTGNAVLINGSNNLPTGITLLKIEQTASHTGDFILCENSGGTDLFRVENDASTYIGTTTTLAKQALEIDQNDDNEPFIKYSGTSAADQTKNISTVNGDGAVEGPKNFSASAGWQYEGMIRVDVNGTDYWMPYYSADTS